MKAIVLLACICMLVPAAAADGVDVEFSAPGFLRGAGALAGSGPWSLGIDVPDATQFLIVADDVDAWTTQSTRIGIEEPLGTGIYRADPDSEATHFDRLSINAISAEHGFIEVAAGACARFDFDDATIWGLTSARSDPMARHTPAFPQALRTWHPPGDALALAASATASILECSDVEITVYDVSGRDDAAGYELASGELAAEEEAMVTGAGASRHQHAILSAAHARLQIDGTTRVLAYAGAAEVSVDGQASFPWAVTSDALSEYASTINDTLVLQGNITLSGWQAMEGDRYRTVLSGDVEAAYINGLLASTPPTTETITAVATATLLTALLAKLAYASALFTRLPADEALKHPRRRALAEYVKEHPGATFRELVRSVDIPAGTCRHHLSVLARSEVLTEHRHKSTVRFFENHGKFDQTWESVVMLREAELADLHGFVEENPGLMQKQILDHAMQTWQWSRSTTQHRLQRLVDGGLLSIHEVGRRKCYHLAQESGPRFRPLGFGQTT